MRIERIDEPIRVLAGFEGGRIRPLRFRWGERTCRIQTVNGEWVDRGGQTPTLHYSVQSGEETYYLRYDSAAVQWWLDRVIVPG